VPLGSTVAASRPRRPAIGRLRLPPSTDTAARPTWPQSSSRTCDFQWSWCLQLAFCSSRCEIPVCRSDSRPHSTVKGRIDGRCKVISQTSALVIDEVIDRSKHAQGLGADALMISPPYLEGTEDGDGLSTFYEAIDAAEAVFRPWKS